MLSFSRKIHVIGINPCIIPPKKTLAAVFKQAKRDKGPIPVHGTVGGVPYKQTLVKYAGEWRLYINGPMLRDSGLKPGHIARMTIGFDSSSREIPMHPSLAKKLTKKHPQKPHSRNYPPIARKKFFAISID